MGGRSPSGETAKTLILVGLILDTIFEAGLLLVGVLFLIAGPIAFLLLAVAAVGLVWVLLIYLYSYARVREADYEGARTPTLVFAILSLVSLALIPGVLFLIAYVKLGDALNETAPTGVAWGAAPAAPLLSAAPPLAGAGRACAHCGRVNPTTAQFCQGCGAPLG